MRREAVRMTGEPAFLTVGADAVLVELGSRQHAAAYGLARSLLDRDTAAARDIVPAATTVLIDGVRDVAVWREALTAEAVSAAVRQRHDVPEAAPTVIGVRYDGPDLEGVAEAWQCAPPDVVARHAATTFTVAFCGFAPGFAYCTSDPPLPPVPRRADPRPRVPAGSVALAAEYCGVYPRSVPGGWQLIGTTDAVLFDPRREQPALLSPGSVVRFEAR
jgi:KipI family sensor histidine kinase inhibitor